MLIDTNRFLPLFLTQFFGAFNDNMLKNSLVILITYNLAVQTGSDAKILVTIAAGIFILPFFLFSALAGQLADKYDKAKLTRIIKIFEIIIMLFACLGFIMQNPWFLIGVLFASGVHSTFFGPIKYAILPQHLHPNELLTGNAYIEAGTFLAILLGTISGGLLILLKYGEYVVSLGLLVIAICGYITSRFIPQAPPPVPRLKINFNLAQETLNILKYSCEHSKVEHAILAISWFWFIGATFLAQLPTFVKEYLHTEAKIVTLFLTIFSVGIAVGSYACNRLLKGAIKSTYVPAAAFGMSLFIIDLYFSSTNKIYFDLHGLLSAQQFLHMQPSIRVMLDLFFIAVCGGIYIVPLYTIMQHKGDKNYMARIIAANNICNALFMVLAAIFTLCMLTLHKSIPDIFLTIGIVNLIVGLLIRRYFNHRI